MEKVNKTKVKIADIIKTTLFILFMLIAVVGVSLAIFEKKNRSGLSIFNHQAMIVLTDSMGECEETDVSNFKIKSIPVKSMVFIENVPEDDDESYEWYSKIEVGDVLTFKYYYDRQIIVTHRVIEINTVESHGKKGFVFSLMGDNKESGSNPGVQIIDTTDEGSFNFVIGKVTGQSIFLGNIMSFLKSKKGIGLVVVLPSLTLLIYEIIKIYSILHEGKKEKLTALKDELQSENDAQKEEIEKLKRELEMAKREQQNNDIKSEGKEEEN